MPASDARDRARRILAAQFETMGSAYANLAGLVRGGWENFWITPCLDALTSLVLLSPHGDEDDDEG